MFTVAVDREGRRVQFKTGYDDLDVYRVGDAVPFAARDPDDLNDGYRGPWVSGSVPDDVYDGVYEDGGDSGGWLDVWVVVKGHRLVAVRPVVRPFPDNRPGTTDDPTPWPQRQRLLAEYGIRPPPYRTLFTLAALKRHRAWRAERRRRANAEMRAFRERTKDMTPEQVLVEVTADYTRARMREPGFFRRIMPPAAVTSDG